MKYKGFQQEKEDNSQNKSLCKRNVNDQNKYKPSSNIYPAVFNGNMETSKVAPEFPINTYQLDPV
jgi:hypothetical protein